MSVRAVVTGKDMPVEYGIIPWTPDEYPLAVDRVRFIGDGVAAVAAVDEDTAVAALAKSAQVRSCMVEHWFHFGFGRGKAGISSTSPRARSPMRAPSCLG